MPVSFRRVGPVANVAVDSSLVDAMGIEMRIEMRQGLADAVSRVARQTGLERVVLSGTRQAFAIGDDAREPDAEPMQPQLVDIVAKIETSVVPWIAAIDGAALGAGCALALGCRFHIASPGSVKP